MLNLVQFYIPPEWNSEASSFCPAFLSLCGKKTLNLVHNFWTIRDWDFRFGMHAITNETLFSDTKVTFILFWTLLPGGSM